MNERIIELAKQAEIYAGELIDEGADYNQYPRYYTEKFAELIVRECCDELRREWYELNAENIDDAFADPRATGIHIGQKTGAIKCISRIKEHFGVE